MFSNLMVIYALIFPRYFPQSLHITQQIRFTKVFPSAANFSADSTVAMRIRCLVQVHNLLIQPGFEQSISVS